MLRVESRQVPATAPAFYSPHLHLAPPLEVTPFEFCRDFRRRKLESLGYGVALFPWSCV